MIPAMSALLDYPFDLLAVLVTKWLDMPLIGKLDSAFCSKSWRKTFLELIGSQNILLRGLDFCTFPSYINWLIVRNLSVEEVIVIKTCEVPATRIKTLTFEFAPNCDINVVVEYFADRCISLTELNLCIMFRVFDTLVEQLAKNNPNLTKCALMDCTGITRASFISLGQHCLQLTTFSLAYNDDLDHLDLVEFCKLKPNLTSLTVEACNKFNGKCLSDISRYCPLLKEFHLSGDQRLTCDELSHITKNCQQLTSLGFGVITFSTLAAIDLAFSHCPHLLSLNMHSCEQIGSDNFRAIMKHLPHLTQLNVSNTDVLDNHTLQCLCQYNKKLQSIDCSTDNREIHNVMTDFGVKTLVEKCSELHTLIFSGAKLLTDQAIRCVTNSIKTTLTELSVSQCHLLTNDSLLYLSEHCKVLNKLDIAHCNNICSFGVYHLIVSCKTLRDLTVSRYHMKGSEAAIKAAKMSVKIRTVR